MTYSRCRIERSIAWTVIGTRTRRRIRNVHVLPGRCIAHTARKVENKQNIWRDLLHALIKDIKICIMRKALEGKDK